MKAARIGSAELKDLVARTVTLDLNFSAPTLVRLAALRPAGTSGPAGADESVRLTASVGFGRGPEGHPQLQLKVSGSVPLVCQRCLELLVLPVDLDVLLTIVRSDAEAASLADPFDTVLLEAGELVLAHVVEDEVLALLPLAPRHADTSACGQAQRGVPAGPNRPLAGLAKLLGRSDRQTD